MLDKNKVLVGMSGGVDSSVTAALIKDMGYTPIGVTFQPYTTDKPHCHCYSELDAKDVCDKLGIEHHFIDYTEIFKRQIIDYFVDEYLQGRTPNPCTKCNPEIKFGELLKFADSLGIYWIASGHYVNVRYDEELKRHLIVRSKNLKKDQSYVLWGLKEFQISRAIFPIGNMDKDKTRELARQYNFENHNRWDSQDVCFIPANNYEEYLWEEKREFLENLGEGYIIKDGKILGKHKGYPFYTIGQRHGLGVSYSEPLFVKQIIPESNTIVVGTKGEVENKGLVAHTINLVKYDELPEPKDFFIKIRYNDKGSYGKAWTENGKIFVEFNELKDAITPGQSVVLYENDDLVGGGIIEKSF